MSDLSKKTSLFFIIFNLFIGAFTLFDTHSSSAWAEGVPELLGRLSEVQEGDEIVIGRDDLAYYLIGLKRWGGDRADVFIQHIDAIRLVKGLKDVDIYIEMDHSFELQLADKDTAKNYQVYAVSIPSVIHAKLLFINGKVTLSGLDEGPSTLLFHIKTPYSSSNVWLRNVTLDIASRELWINIGLLNDYVPLTITTEAGTQMAEKISFCESIPERLRFTPCPEP